KKFEDGDFINPFFPFEMTIGGQPGALLSIKAKPDKGSALMPRIVFLRAPSGAEVDLNTAKKTKRTVKLDEYKDIALDELGTYTVGVATQLGAEDQPTGGDLGVIQLKIKHPKFKASKRDEVEIIVDPILDQVDPDRGFDNRQVDAVLVTGDFIGTNPVVTLVGDSSTITATGVSRLSDEGLLFNLDLDEEPAGTYDVTVTLPNGGVGVIADGFTVDPTPRPAGMTPDSGFDNETKAVTLSGQNFLAGLTVTLTSRDDSSTVSASVLGVDDDSVDLSVPLRDVTLGEYDVTVLNPDGGTRTLEMAFTVNRGNRLTSATPLLGHDNQDAVEVNVTGDSFVDGLTCVLQKPGQPDLSGAVTYNSSTDFDVVFDLVGKDDGNWDLRATNPDGATAVLADPFVIARAPRVTGISPNRGFEIESLTGVNAGGSDMVDGAQANLERGGNSTATGTNEQFVSQNSVLFDVDLDGMASGLHDLRVTNPDGGTEVFSDAFWVLGDRSLVSGVNQVGKTSVAYNGTLNEYLVVWDHYDGTQWDLSAQRFDALTGAPVGSVIVLTSSAVDSSSTEDQRLPAVEYSSYLDKYFVVFRWTDANADGDKVKVCGQFVDGDGTLNTPQFNACTFFAQQGGVADGPDVAWNPDRKEWMLVWGWDTSAGGDVYYQVFDEGTTLPDGRLIPGSVNSGILISSTHSGEEGDIEDADYEPAVAYSPSAKEYIVSYSYDFTEVATQSNPNPTDTGSDVRARIYDGDFSSGPSQQASFTSLGNETGNQRNEQRSSVAYSSAQDDFLVAWDYITSAGDHDLRVWVIDATTRSKVGGAYTRVEATSTDDATHAHLFFDPTSGSESWVVVYAINTGDSGNSSIELARYPSVATGNGLGTVVRETLQDGVDGETHTTGGGAARGQNGEVLTAWPTAGGSDDARTRSTK
ncbi:MAG: hypothetical protein ACYTG4_08960, partial [Planctomycetota bacterium]